MQSQPNYQSTPFGKLKGDQLQSIKNGTIVSIRTKLNKRVLDVSKTQQKGHAAGELILYDSYGAANQRFVLQRDQPDWIIKNFETGKALAVADASHEDGARVREEQYIGKPNQKWRLQELSPHSGDFYIYNSNSGKVLDVPEEKGENDVTVFQYTFNGNKNQIWKLCTE